MLIQILRDYSERYGGLKIWFTEFAVSREHEESTIIQYIQGGHYSRTTYSSNTERNMRLLGAPNLEPDTSHLKLSR